jgi:hypothetical protein
MCSSKTSIHVSISAKVNCNSLHKLYKSCSHLNLKAFGNKLPQKSSTPNVGLRTSVWCIAGLRQLQSITKKLLEIAGIERNPGPKQTQAQIKSKTQGSSPSFSILHINSQSLRYKLNELETE